MLDLGVKPDHVSSQPQVAPGAQEFYLSALGYLHRNDIEKNIDTAIQLFRQVIELDPNFALAHAGISEAYLYKYRTLGDPTWVNLALISAKSAGKMAVNSSYAYTTLGAVYGQIGRYDDAIEQFRLALESDPRSPKAYEGLADAYWSTGRRPEAEASLSKAVQIQPGDWSVYKRLGLFYCRHGEYRKAIDQFEQVVSLTPDNAQGYSNIGGFYYLLGELETARSHWETALNLDPNRISVVGNLASYWFEIGNFQIAAEYYKKAIGLALSSGAESSAYRFWGNLGAAYRKLQRREESLDAYRRASELVGEHLAINPNNKMSKAHLAHYLSALNEGPQSRILVEEILASGTADPAVLSSIAQTLAQLGDCSGAKALRGRVSAIDGKANSPNIRALDSALSECLNDRKEEN